MKQAELDQLEQEDQVGRKAATAYENFIGPFMDAKRMDLFDAFQTISINEPEMLQETKRQLLVLNTLDQEIKTIIETGKMASQQLSQIPKERH